MAGLPELLRWEQAGGTWRVAHQSPTSVTVSLLQCDGGQEVERFTSEDPEILAYLGS